MSGNFETFRHINVGNQYPAVTFYFNVNFDEDEFLIGWARCSSKDRFDKKIGRHISKGTAESRGITAPYDPSRSLVSNAISAIQTTIRAYESVDVMWINDLKKVLETCDLYWTV